jgi:hypothetical protein
MFHAHEPFGDVLKKRMGMLNNPGKTRGMDREYDFAGRSHPIPKNLWRGWE